MWIYWKDLAPTLPAVWVQEVAWPSQSLAALPSDCCLLFPQSVPAKEA